MENVIQVKATAATICGPDVNTTALRLTRVSVHNTRGMVKNQAAVAIKVTKMTGAAGKGSWAAKGSLAVDATVAQSIDANGASLLLFDGDMDVLDGGIFTADNCTLAAKTGKLTCTLPKPEFGRLLLTPDKHAARYELSASFKRRALGTLEGATPLKLGLLVGNTLYLSNLLPTDCRGPANGRRLVCKAPSGSSGWKA